MTLHEFSPLPPQPRWQRAVDWIEKYCISDRGGRVHLCPDEQAQLRQIFELGNPPPADLGRMSAFLALISLCGPEPLREVMTPWRLEVDCWSVWRAAGYEVRDVLQRRGESITCDELGTRFPAAA
jgi:hypothetical protein